MAIPPVPFCQITLKAQKPPDTVYPRLLGGLGGHIRKRRLEEKITGEELARLIGVNMNTVYKWERNLFTPPIWYMERIFKFLGYDPGWMVTRLCGKEIVAYRGHHGLSLKDLARILGVDPGALRRWERNECRPPRRIFERISSLLKSGFFR